MPGRTTNNLEAESSRKRPRIVVDDDEDIVEVREARSGLRADTRKRVRVSGTESVKDARRSIRESTPEDSPIGDANGADDGRANPNSDSPPKTQYEVMRDGNFDHLRHEAFDDQRATQRLRFRPNLLGDNAIADNGIIESITCVNFMCHQRLHCELGPLLNFIVGENGSGKSAILTAITLCLGGKASSTNRGGSLKSFVKEGCERAVLSVKIKNQGQDAYKHDIYGDSIVVERHFSKTGSSGFKVKTEMGQTHSTKKQEVEEIVEYYALQVDNPLNVLSQDNARQFLNASTKSQKYKFFIEGVQLQQLDNDYRLISESLEQMKAKIPEQESRVKRAKEALDKAKQRKEAAEGQRQIRLKYKILRSQLVWARVADEEADLAKRREKLAGANAALATAEQLVVEKTHSLQVADEKVARAEEAIFKAKGEVDGVQRRAEDASEVFKGLRNELQRVHVDEREAHQQLKNAIDDSKDLKQKIADEEHRLKEAGGELHSLKRQESKDAKKKVVEIGKDIDLNKKREPEFTKRQEEVNVGLGKTDDEIQQKRKEIVSVQTAIKELEEKSGNPFDGYEAGMSNLVRAIENESRFDNKPIGPLGAHIQLLKPEWGSILEQTFGANLNGFIVTSKRDQKLLFELIDRFKLRQCPVLLGNGHRLDLRGKEPDESFDTILRTLKVDNLLVRDQLVLHHMIEQIILIPDRVKAQEVMFDGAVPRNVKACLAIQDGGRGQGLRLMDNNGSISTTPIGRGQVNGRPRMKTDSGFQLAFHKESMRKLEAEYRAIEGERRRLVQESQRCKDEVKRLKKDRASLENQQRVAQLAADKIDDELDKFEGNDSRLQGLQEQLAELATQEKHHGMQYGLLAGKRGDKNKEVEEAQKKLKEAKSQFREVETQVDKAEDKRKRLSESRRIILTELNEAIANVELCKDEKKAFEGKAGKQADYLAGCIEQSLPVSGGQRVEVPEGETSQSLEKKYQALEQRLKEGEAKLGQDKDIYEQVTQATQDFEKVVNDLKSIQQVNQGLHNTLKLRLEKWRKFQRYISSQSRANFIYLLSERGFRGKLLLDHERKALDLQVEPDQTERRAGGRNTKTLSGGEKSFSSICLLLAIWEAMGSPLRCLDEFDVFMDNVNRAISTNMLITAARRSVNRQYIFITPNAIEGRNTLDKDVKIIRFVFLSPVVVALD
ncbi:P-loop containing nucleoside triphosphate hydrolase protein [Lasiosphaeria hispida]|uniref:P-loop containing nucleoside triphosphate hydrolase protein n=1 Tax=Lasiosphaeria hispida TaxID=260671 RepID=A0AAJ0HAY2_9PEZI|nr:P-loop containing nucleoside triphosphate hydrolase protein [Lasiosphaeria hispida]